MFKHFLLPIDGSRSSLGAVETGVALAARVGACVHVFHVIQPYFETFIRMPETVFRDAMDEQAGRYLAKACERARTAGVSCTSSYVRDEHPHMAILAVADELGCDLIVMASHRPRGLDLLIMGSETHKVVLSGTIPVLICPPKAEHATEATPGVRFDNGLQQRR